MRLLPFALLVLAIACGDVVPPDGGGNVVPALPLGGSYQLTPIDSPDVVVGISSVVDISSRPVALTNAGEVIGAYQTATGTGRFKWSNGKLTLNAAPSGFQLIAVNRRGDIVGDLGAGRPIVWLAEDAMPTRLFSSDTAVVALGISDRREVLLAPSKQYFPGASIWLDGTVKSLGLSVPVTPHFITDSGLVWVTSRGTLIDTSWFTPSPFGPTTPFHPACPATPARSFSAVGDRKLFSTVAYRSVSYDYVDNGHSCRNLTFSVSEFHLATFLKNGFFGGYGGTNPKQYPAISNGLELINIYQLLDVFPDVWGLNGAIAMNDSGVILVSAKKMKGYGIGKPGLVLLVPRK